MRKERSLFVEKGKKPRKDAAGLDGRRSRAWGGGRGGSGNCAYLHSRTSSETRVTYFFEYPLSQSEGEKAPFKPGRKKNLRRRWGRRIVRSSHRARRGEFLTFPKCVPSRKSPSLRLEETKRDQKEGIGKSSRCVFQGIMGEINS